MGSKKIIKYAGAIYRLAETFQVDNGPYGPGKFSDLVGQWLYDRILEGWSDEELGDVQDFGHYDLVAFDKPVMVKEQDGTSWQFGAAIVTEDSQGFVEYETFDTAAQAEQKWAEIEAEYATVQPEVD